MTVTRRDLIRLLGVGALLTACAPATSAPVSGTGTGPARRGGTLRAVFTGGGAAESLDPYMAGSPVDFVRNDVLYDSLFMMSGAEVKPALATGVEPGDKSVTVRLRKGVLWHDGKPFTAADVVHSLRYMSDPKRSYPSELGMYFDTAGAKARDDLTVVIPTRVPIGDPALFLAAFPGKMVREEPGIGTGPFKVGAFAAGQQARLVRFDKHWAGQAPADELVLISVSDPQAKVNAVTAGQADYSGDIPFATAKTGVAAPGLEIRSAGPDNRASYGFILNTTKAPFNDPRVRKAVRLGIDRQVLVDTVLLGFGVPGNDLLCSGSRYFLDRPPAPRDLDAARALVRDAGAEGRKVVFRSAEWEAGYNASTELVVEQLKDIGLAAEAQIVGPAEFFDGKAVAAADAVAFSSDPIPLAVIYGRLAGFPPLKFTDADYQAAFDQAVASTDEAVRAKAWQRAQEVLLDRGHTIVWGLADILSLTRTTVAGVEVRGHAKYPYLGNAGLS